LFLSIHIIGLSPRLIKLSMSSIVKFTSYCEILFVVWMTIVGNIVFFDIFIFVRVFYFSFCINECVSETLFLF
jgi:hypothetical protein